MIRAALLATAAVALIGAAFATHAATAPPPARGDAAQTRAIQTLRARATKADLRAAALERKVAALAAAVDPLERRVAALQRDLEALTGDHADTRDLIDRLTPLRTCISGFATAPLGLVGDLALYDRACLNATLAKGAP